MFIYLPYVSYICNNLPFFFAADYLLNANISTNEAEICKKKALQGRALAGYCYAPNFEEVGGAHCFWNICASCARYAFGCIA